MRSSLVWIGYKILNSPWNYAQIFNVLKLVFITLQNKSFEQITIKKHRTVNIVKLLYIFKQYIELFNSEKNILTYNLHYIRLITIFYWLNYQYTNWVDEKISRNSFSRQEWKSHALLSEFYLRVRIVKINKYFSIIMLSFFSVFFKIIFCSYLT